MRVRIVVATALLAALLTGCTAPTPDDPDRTGTAADSESEAETPVEPLDLTGEWRQINSNSADSYQAATISGDVITIDWVNEADSTTAIYWVGSFEAPTEDVDSFSWTSVGDTAAMESALLASQDSAKDFTYEDGKLMYEVTAMGVTVTVEMEQQ